MSANQLYINRVLIILSRATIEHLSDGFGERDSTLPGGGEVLDAPQAARAPAGSHAEMRHGERRRVLPLHQHGARGTVPHGQPAAPPFDQEPLKLVRIHQARRRDSHLWIVS